MRDSKQEILHFWFTEAEPALWFQNSRDFDCEVKSRFMVAYQMAGDGLCDSWKQEADGSLALCLLLDQFPRRMFRGTKQAYATDARALLVAKNAVAKGYDQTYPLPERRFFYLPFQHSEKLTDQKRNLELFEAIRREDPLAYENALRAYKAIEKFGRFPEKNRILGRINTPEEEDYLARKAG